VLKAYKEFRKILEDGFQETMASGRRSMPLQYVPQIGYNL
jgi:hypothetical protein